jgi:hypothetical protein
LATKRPLKPEREVTMLGEEEHRRSSWTVGFPSLVTAEAADQT